MKLQSPADGLQNSQIPAVLSLVAVCRRCARAHSNTVRAHLWSIKDGRHLVGHSAVSHMMTCLFTLRSDVLLL